MTVEEAKKEKLDWLFFMDADMQVPADTILKLMAWDKEIVGCDYSRRAGYYNTTAKDLEGNPLKYYEATEGLKEVDILATGCMLIKMSVFEKLEEPYFDVIWNRDKPSIGEDVYFCRKARASGIPVWCDTGLSKQIGHIGDNIYKIRVGGVDRLEDGM
jgi:GT2 family glycosyltransferase